MKFVVVIPWWLYAIFFVFMLAVGGVIMQIGLVLLLLYLFVKRPLAIIGLVLLGLSFRYWFVTVPLLGLLLLFGVFQKKKVESASPTGTAQALSSSLSTASAHEEPNAGKNQP